MVVTVSADREAPTERIRPNPTSALAIIVPVLIGAAVAIALGAYAKVHDPQGFSINVAGFSEPRSVKSWLTTLAALLALFQLTSALAMYGKLEPVLRRFRRTPPGYAAYTAEPTVPSWIAPAHVWSGRLAVLATVPVVVHCLYALGYQDFETRVLAHSLLGCFFYGIFVCKMLLLTRKGLPGWVIPVAGGLTLTGLIGIWLTSALWFFQTYGVIL